MKLFKVTGYQIWYVVARDKRDVRPLVFRFENKFCRNVARTLEDIRDITVEILGDSSVALETVTVPGVLTVDRLEEKEVE